MLKPNRMGLSKTRLAKDIGATHAHRLNRVLHHRTFRACKEGPWNTILCVAPDKAAPLYQHYGLPVLPQGGGDLGQRLTRAFASVPPGPVLVVGTDSPNLRAQHIHQAFELLRTANMVIGPAKDGGFWLCAISARWRRRWFDQTPFNPVRWSSQWTMRDLVANCGPAAMIAYLEPLIDLDDSQSLHAWQSEQSQASLIA